MQVVNCKEEIPAAALHVMDDDSGIGVPVNLVPEEFCKFDLGTKCRRACQRHQHSNIPVYSNKRLSIDFKDKIAVIKELAAGEKQITVAKKRRIPKSTVQNIWTNREKITAQVKEFGYERKRYRAPCYESIEAKLVQWMNELKASNARVNGPQLRAKAQTIAKVLGVTKFCASSGWLDRFKLRHKISFKKAENFRPGHHDNFNDSKVALDFSTKVWPALCNGFSVHNIFTVTETALFFNSLPMETVALCKETCLGGKLSEERFSLLLGSNSDGSEKLKVGVVGITAQCKYFQGITHQSNLPISWFSNSKAWITPSTIEDWLKEWNANLKSARREVLLIVNSIHTSHLKVKLSNIKLVFLANSIFLQPLNRRIINTFKRNYRRLLLEKLMRKSNELEEEEDLTFRRVSVIESLFIISSAWQGVKPKLIKSGFEKSNLLKFNSETTETTAMMEMEDANATEEDPIFMSRWQEVGIQFPEGITFDDYASVDDNLHATEIPGNKVDKCIDDDSDNSYTILHTATATTAGEPQYLSTDKLTIKSPPMEEVRNSISTLRNFVLLSSQKCDGSTAAAIYTALSQLENMILLSESSTVPIGSTNFVMDENHFLVLEHNGLCDSSNAAPTASLTTTEQSQTVIHGFSQEIAISPQSTFLPVPIKMEESEVMTMVMDAEDEVSNSWTPQNEVTLQSIYTSSDICETKS